MFHQFANRTPEAKPAWRNGRASPPSAAAQPAAAAGRSAMDFTDLKVRLHQRLLEMLNLAAIDKVPLDELRREVGAMVRELLLEDGVALNSQEYNRLVEDILDEVLGLGPLEPLLKDPTISDILVNTHAQVFVERAGQLERTPVRFKDDRHLLRIIDKIVSASGAGWTNPSPGSTPAWPTARASMP
jgi:pilus assembly protein CpaF